MPRRARGPNFVWSQAAIAKLRALVETKTPHVKAAASLGVGLSAYNQKLKRLGLAKPQRSRRHTYVLQEANLVFPKYGPHQSLTARLMGDPPPGRTPWATTNGSPPTAANHAN